MPLTQPHQACRFVSEIGRLRCIQHKDKTVAKIVHQSHDKLFRASMSDIRVASDFFSAHLPDVLLSKLDFATLSLQKSTFIDEAYQSTEADLLYSVKLGESVAYLYILCEHQSEIDKYMAFRLLVYIVRAIELHRKRHPKESLPLIYPLVVYSGEKPWNAPMDIHDLFGEEENLARQVMFKPYQLIDLARLDDQEIRRHVWAGLFEFALKYRSVVRNVEAFCDTFFPWLKKMEQQAESYCKIMLSYVINESDINDEKLFVQKAQEHLTGNLRGEAMTLTMNLNKGIEKA